MRQTREREAIVITGTYAFRPLPAPTQQEGRTLYLHLTAPTTKPSFSNVGAGFKALSGYLDDLTGLPVVMETTLPERGAPNLEIDRSLFAYLNGRKAMDAATVDVLLANVAKQTSLALKRERRVMPMWVPADVAATQAAATQPSPG